MSTPTSRPPILESLGLQLSPQGYRVPATGLPTHTLSRKYIESRGYRLTQLYERSVTFLGRKETIMRFRKGEAIILLFYPERLRVQLIQCRTSGRCTEKVLYDNKCRDTKTFKEIEDRLGIH